MSRALLAIDDSTQRLLFVDARTANTFTEDPVTVEQIFAIYELVKWAPTLTNIQPLRIVAVVSPKSRELLVSHMAEGNKEKTATAPMTVILAADTNFHDTLPTVFPHAVGAREKFLDDAARIRVAHDQAWMQAGYFIVGVRAAGLAAGPMAGFDKAGVDAAFLAGTSLESFVVINIGHPGENAWKERLPLLAAEVVITVV